MKHNALRTLRKFLVAFAVKKRMKLKDKRILKLF